MNVISGLFNKHATGVGIHPGQTGNILSGAPLQKGAELQGGVSIDQVLASRIGEETVQPSMVLGCEQPITGYHETNFSMAYSSHISWQNATSPVPMEVYPSLAFDSLFDNRGSQRNQSILDRVTEQAAGLSRQVSAADRAKLDEYLTSVREVEQRSTGCASRTAKADERARQTGDSRVHDEAARQRPARGHPRAHAADVRHRRPRLPDRQDPHRHAAALPRHLRAVLSVPRCRNAHHPASHDDRSDAFMRITHYYVSQLAYLAGRLDAMPEGEGTVLDNSCLMFISNMWSGSQHDSSKVPVLLAGGLGGDARNRPRARLLPTMATTTASSAACICRSWIAWASRLTNSATPTRASHGSDCRPWADAFPANVRALALDVYPFVVKIPSEGGCAGVLSGIARTLLPPLIQ